MHAFDFISSHNSQHITSHAPRPPHQMHTHRPPHLVCLRTCQRTFQPWCSTWCACGVRLVLLLGRSPARPWRTYPGPPADPQTLHVTSEAAMEFSPVMLPLPPLAARRWRSLAVLACERGILVHRGRAPAPAPAHPARPAGLARHFRRRHEVLARDTATLAARWHRCWRSCAGRGESIHKSHKVLGRGVGRACAQVYQ